LGRKQSNKTHVACVWDRNFPTKITAQISNEYSLYDTTNIRLRFYAVFHSPNSETSSIRYNGIRSDDDDSYPYENIRVAFQWLMTAA